MVSKIFFLQETCVKSTTQINKMVIIGGLYFENFMMLFLQFVMVVI